MTYMMGTEKNRREVEELFSRRNIEYISLSEETGFRWRVILKSPKTDTSATGKLIEGLHSSIVVESLGGAGWMGKNDWQYHVIFFFKDHFENTFTTE